MMETFEPDEYAMDAIEPEVIEAISEAEKAGNQPAPELTDMSNGYKPPNNDLLLVRVSQRLQVSLGSHAPTALSARKCIQIAFALYAMYVCCRPAGGCTLADACVLRDVLRVRSAQMSVFVLPQWHFAPSM